MRKPKMHKPMPPKVPGGKVKEPSRRAVYKKRVAKPEHDDIPGKPKRRTNYPKGFI